MEQSEWRHVMLGRSGFFTDSMNPSEQNHLIITVVARDHADIHYICINGTNVLRNNVKYLAERFSDQIHGYFGCVGEILECSQMD